jgi:predicted TIM-barrel fold metal-dependent hydrolase
VYTGIQLTETASPPHYLMINSKALQNPDQLFYRTYPSIWSFGFLKHAVRTLLGRKRTFRGMTIPNLLHDMRMYGISKSVVLPIEYQDGIARSSQLIEGCRHVPELIPFCSVHPKDPEKVSRIRKYIQRGAKGLKLHPNLQRIRPDSRESFELYEEYAQYRLPLIMHSGLTGRESYFRFARKLSRLEFIEAIPGNFPEMPIVLAHAGIAQYTRGIALAQQHKNVYLELSGQPAYHIRQALVTVGADRLLFGTDWPFWNQALALQAVQKATRHDQAAAQSILSENAQRLLRI